MKTSPIAQIRQWYTIQNAADSEEAARVDIYDFIGEGWSWDGDERGVSARKFAKDFRAIKAKQIDVHINSPGGLVHDGIAIYNAIRNHKATVTVHIDGLAASIASVIAMAGDEIRMAKNAFMMIHDPWDFAMGTAEQMRKCAEALDKVKNKLAETYADRSGETPIEKFAELMAEESWLTAEECLDLGMIDAIDGESSEGVSRDAAACLDRYGNVPAAIKKQMKAAARSAPEAPMPKIDEKETAKTRKALKAEEAKAAEEETTEEEAEEEMETKEDAAETKAAKSVKASPRAATSAELRAALPDSTADFRETCTEQKLTVEQAKAMWAMAKPATAKPAANPGGPTVKDKKPALVTDEEGDDGGDVAQQWNALVARHMKSCGGNRQRAMAAANRENPELREAFIEAHNAKHGRKVG